MVVGTNVRRYRGDAGLSQEGLAARMGVDRAYVSGLELGRRNPTILTLWHTALALKVPPSKLLEIDGPLFSRPSSPGLIGAGSGAPAASSRSPKILP